MTEQDESTFIMECSHDDIRNIIEWQRERYHHVQSLSVGFITAFLAVITVIATGYSIFHGDIPSAPFENNRLINELANQMGYAPIFIQSVLILNYLVSFVMGAIAILFGLIAISSLVDIVTRRDFLESLNSPSNTILIKQNSEVGSPVIGKDFSSYLSRSVRENQIRLRHLNSKLIGSVLRMLLFLVFSGVAVYVYYLLTEASIHVLIFLNGTIVTPVPGNLLIQYIWAPPDSDNDVIQPTLFEEMSSDSESTRWDAPDLTLWEKVLMVVLTALSAFSVILWIMYSII